MEERLRAFIEENSVTEAPTEAGSTAAEPVSSGPASASAAAAAADIPADAVAIVRFVQHQVPFEQRADYADDEETHKNFLFLFLLAMRISWWSWGGTVCRNLNSGS